MRGMRCGGGVNPDIWDRTQNPWVTLQESSQLRLDQVAQDPAFQDELQRLQAAHQQYLDDPAWYGQVHAAAGPRRIAYFSMEFGLGESLPLYAGGLGVLAGDYLKTASDLGVPVVGVGLLYQEGYSRQVLDAAGRPQDLFPYNDPTSLPLVPDAGFHWRLAARPPGSPGAVSPAPGVAGARGPGALVSPG